MDKKLQDLADKIIEYAGQSGVQYCDARAEQQVNPVIFYPYFTNYDEL